MNSSMPVFAVARYSTLVCGLVALLLVGSFIPASPARSISMGVLTTLLPLAALQGLGREPKRQRFASGLALVFVATLWGAYTMDSQLWQLTARITAFALMAYLTWAILDEVFRAERISADTLYGAAAVYFLIGLAFAAAYEVVDMCYPSSFQGALVEQSPLANLVYFSFVTLSTLGYGDITPTSSPARSLAILEAIVGVLYTTILLARLVGLFSPTRASGPEAPQQ